MRADPACMPSSNASTPGRPTSARCSAADRTHWLSRRSTPGKEDSMDNQQFRFDDGAAYEDFMGKWSQLAGEVFLDWLAPPAQARWADVGCGNGAFTELL